MLGSRPCMHVQAGRHELPHPFAATPMAGVETSAPQLAAEQPVRPVVQQGAARAQPAATQHLGTHDTAGVQPVPNPSTTTHPLSEHSDVRDGLLMIHNVLRRSMERVDLVLAEMTNSAHEDGGERIRRFAVFVEYVLHGIVTHHGTEEDVFFPWIERRAGDEAEWLQRFQLEHEQLMEALADSMTRAKALCTVTGDASTLQTAAQEMRESMAQVSEQLLPHLQGEEDEFTEHFARRFWTLHEMKQIGKECGKHSGETSRRLPRPWLALAMTYYNTEPGRERNEMAAVVPWPVREVLLRRVFAHKWRPYAEWMHAPPKQSWFET